MEQGLEEKKVTSTEVYHGSFLRIYEDKVLLPNGREAFREYVKHPGATAVVPITSDGRIVLVRQYRYPVGKVTLEIPAGKLDAGEEPLICAKRELKEETGYVAESWTKLTSLLTTPGFTDEVIHLYKAESMRFDEACPDEDEFIHTCLCTPEEIRRMIADETIVDAKTLVALFMAGI